MHSFLLATQIAIQQIQFKRKKDEDADDKTKDDKSRVMLSISGCLSGFTQYSRFQIACSGGLLSISGS